EEALCGFACRNSQADGKTCPEEDFHSETAGYRKRFVWSRGGYRFFGSCIGKKGCQRRYNRCLGRCREVHFNKGLCAITTRLPVADLADHEGSSAPRRELEHLSSDAGAKLLRALGVTRHEEELRNASDEFSGHCLALTLLQT